MRDGTVEHFPGAQPRTVHRGVRPRPRRPPSSGAHHPARRHAALDGPGDRPGPVGSDVERLCTEAPAPRPTRRMPEHAEMPQLVLSVVHFSVKV